MWSGGLGLVAFQVFVEMSWTEGLVQGWISSCTESLVYGIMCKVKALSALLVWWAFIKECLAPVKYCLQKEIIE